MIVDAFLSVHLTIPAEIPRQGPPSEVLNTIARSRQVASTGERAEGVDEITTSASELLTAYELARALAGQGSLGNAGDVIAQHLRRLIPASLCVLYLYDRKTDELEARFVVGDGSTAVRGLRISLGQRLSGWVAANRQTISNSDASLDLAEAVESRRGYKKLHKHTADFEDELIGVLSLYSAELSGFNEDHKRIIEAVARQVAQAFQSSSELVTFWWIPSLQQLERRDSSDPRHVHSD